MSTRTIAIDDDSYVERPAPGAAPTAFRIWRAGENPDDEGTSYFTPKSAELLTTQQDSRQRVYSFDFNHLSLLGHAGSSRMAGAAGWHRLEVRLDESGEPELWAVEIEWCADAKEGLETNPPHWRFFSPAFDVDSYGEIVSYTNCALCINPLTHGLPALAAHTVRRVAAATHGVLTMDIQAALAVIDALLEKVDGEAKEQLQLLRDFLGKMAEATDGTKADDAADDAGDLGAAEEVLNAAGADGDGDEDESMSKTTAKKNAAGGASSPVMKLLAKAMSRIDELEKDHKQSRMQRLLSAHPTLTPTARKLLSSLPPSAAEKLVDEMLGKPKTLPVAKRNSAAVQGGNETGVRGSVTDVDREVDRAMGIRTTATRLASFERDAEGNQRFNAITPREARRLSAAAPAKKEGV